MNKGMRWSQEVDKMVGKLIQTRCELHEIPELAFQELETADYVVRRLTELGIECRTGIVGTGVAGWIPGSHGRKTYCFRADMDALEVVELNEVPFKSKKQGKMHACGHDGHMTILLGLAEVLVKGDFRLGDNVLLLFQPGEEGTGGAEKIVKSGLLDEYQVNEIYGLHLFPGIEQGKLGVRPGPMMAQNSEIDLTIWGENAHGGTPHMGNDALVVASQLLLAIQTIISRSLNPLDPAVITFGRMSGGEVRNMIARQVQLEGTIRTFREDTYETLKSRLLAVVRGMELTYQCQVDVDLREMYPAVNNPLEMVESFMQAQGKEHVELVEPVMLAEDFAFYQKKYPGLFFFLGTRNEEKGLIHSLHHGRFNFDEQVLATGVQAYLNILIHKAAFDVL
ncbi:M20 metallopeptidase family protein [Anoxynatronum buryatiense]|uniref:Hippurate hydrolase n=1 Tax=Anoxynatronum buryatiense TaxID=489973 RepID=A0AA46AHQ3_9CLOT|nr:M20 family metallopeptidase [Anoxynatronum buryatiense]SMP41242.1 hippurate hydrolase [Anoxynatronum buryatiense]